MLTSFFYFILDAYIQSCNTTFVRWGYYVTSIVPCGIQRKLDWTVKLVEQNFWLMKRLFLFLLGYIFPLPNFS